MAKVIGPLHSDFASGQFAKKTVVFSRYRKSINRVQKGKTKYKINEALAKNKPVMKGLSGIWGILLNFHKKKWKELAMQKMNTQFFEFCRYNFEKFSSEQKFFYVPDTQILFTKKQYLYSLNQKYMDYSFIASKIIGGHPSGCDISDRFRKIFIGHYWSDVVSVFDVESLEFLRYLSFAGPMLFLCVDGIDRLIMTPGMRGSSVAFYQMSNLSLVYENNIGSGFTFGVVTKNLQYFVCASAYQNRVYVMSTQTGETVFSFQIPFASNQIVYCRETDTILIHDEQSQKIYRYNYITGELLEQKDFQYFVFTLNQSFQLDLFLAASSDWKRVFVFDTKNIQKVYETEADRDVVYAHFSRNGLLMYVLYRNPTTFAVYSLLEKKKMKEISLQTECLYFSSSVERDITVACDHYNQIAYFYRHIYLV
jgi:muconolactone delta-isomerase